MEIDRNSMIGIAQTLACVMLIGSAPSFAAVSYAHGAGPMTVGAFRGAAMMGSCFPAMLAMRREIDRAKAAVLLPLCAAYVIFIWAYQVAIKEGSASQALLVLYVHPVIAMLFQGWRGKVELGRRHLAMGVLSLLGIAIAADPFGAAFSLEAFSFAALGSIACAAVIVLYDEASRAGIKGGTTTFAIGAASLLALGPTALVLEGPAFPSGAAGWGAMLVSSAGVAAGLSLFVAAIARIGILRTMLLGNIEPVVGLACAAFIAGEGIGWNVAFGAAVVIGAAIDWPAAMSVIHVGGRAAEGEE